MSAKFGADFNASQPSDADLVKKGAQWIRDIKTRIKSTFGVMFNLETGQLLDNVVVYTSLKTLNPDPTGSWNRVSVNNKGLVTAGEEETVVISAKPYRWVYNYTTGLGPDGLVVARSLVLDDDALNVASYSFTVPAGVTRLNVRVFGAGGGGGYNATPLTAQGGGGGGYTETLVDVSEGDVFLIWAGEGGIGRTSAGVAGNKGAMTKFQFDAFRYAKASGGLAGTNTAAGAPGAGETTSSVSGWGPNFNLEGNWGTPYTGGSGGGGGGGGTASNIGSGGLPASSGAGGNAGSMGAVVIDYWKN